MFVCDIILVCQVQRGYDVLEELEDALATSGKNKAALLETLSAKFYQVGYPAPVIMQYSYVPSAFIRP